VYEALSYWHPLCLRSQVCVQLLEALTYYCIRPDATSAWGVKLLASPLPRVSGVWSYYRPLSYHSMRVSWGLKLPVYETLSYWHRLFIGSQVCVSMYLCVCVSVCLSVHYPIHIYIHTCMPFFVRMKKKNLFNSATLFTYVLALLPVSYGLN
jgi:hypothetical protein